MMNEKTPYISVILIRYENMFWMNYIIITINVSLQSKVFTEMSQQQHAIIYGPIIYHEIHKWLAYH